MFPFYVTKKQNLLQLLLIKFSARRATQRKQQPFLGWPNKLDKRERNADVGETHLLFYLCLYLTPFMETKTSVDAHLYKYKGHLKLSFWCENQAEKPKK